MVNPLRGVAPLDPTTDTGKLRTLIGDTTYVALDPAEAGFGAYVSFGDLQLQSFLALGGGTNLAYGVGYAFESLAAQFAADAIKFTTDDEAVDLTARAESMRKIAAEWFNRGDIIERKGNQDFFLIEYPFGPIQPPWPHPELAEPAVWGWWGPLL